LLKISFSFPFEIVQKFVELIFQIIKLNDILKYSYAIVGTNYNAIKIQLGFDWCLNIMQSDALLLSEFLDHLSVYFLRTSKVNNFF